MSNFLRKYFTYGAFNSVLSEAHKIQSKQRLAYVEDEGVHALSLQETIRTMPDSEETTKRTERNLDGLLAMLGEEQEAHQQQKQASVLRLYGYGGMGLVFATCQVLVDLSQKCSADTAACHLLSNNTIQTFGDTSIVTTLLAAAVCFLHFQTAKKERLYEDIATGNMQVVEDAIRTQAMQESPSDFPDIHP